MQFSTSTVIHAPPARIWALLTDAAGYPRWNPTVTRIEGRIALGERIAVHATISPKRPFPATVAVLEPEQRMVWSNAMPLGLFKGERTFQLHPAGAGAVQFDMAEVFSGLLLPLIGRTIPDLQPAFEDFAGGLKAAAEAG